MPTKPLNVLLSIVTWNHAKTIRATLESIYKQSFQSFQVVVFDNNSMDGTIDILDEYDCHKNFTIIRNNDNVGFCGGHNHVITHYNYDIIVLVNPDIVLTNNYLEQVLKTFELDPQVGAVCGLLVQSFDENPIIDSMGMSLTRSRRFSLINHGEHVSSVKIKSGYVAGLDGALPAFKKEAVDSLLINGEFFNTLFFSHKEDWDVSWRMMLYNWKVYFNKDCVAVHPRHFKPNNLKERLKIDDSIKFHGFKNQFLLLLINEDRKNFLKDSLIIVPRLLITSFYCLFLERKSLRAYSFIISNRRKIFAIRRKVQEKRKLAPIVFRHQFL